MFGRRKNYGEDGRDRSSRERAVFYGINGQKFVQGSPGVAVNPDYRPGLQTGNLPVIYDPKVLTGIEREELLDGSDIGRIACLFTEEIESSGVSLLETM